MVKKVLLIVAHPHLQRSRSNRALVEAARGLPHVTVHDLYENYPDFNIAVDREQALLLAHDVIVFQFPFYWYSSPALLKQWQDDVLTWGFAYGDNGVALKDKKLFCSITTGSPEYVYQAGSRNNFTVSEFLRPFQQTTLLCHMRYGYPFLLHGSSRMTDEQIAARAQEFRARLEAEGLGLI